MHHSRQAANLTPARYLAESWVRRASELLVSEPRRPITDITLDCGFASRQNFANVFMRQMGCSLR
jgi:transcriptional regulator GlxA family with amidase domain